MTNRSVALLAAALSIHAAASAQTNAGVIPATAGTDTSSASSPRQNLAIATLAVSPSATTARQGSAVTFIASVSPAGATGAVSFYDGVAFLGRVALSSGAASFSTSTLAPGARNIKAYYSGDSVYAPAVNLFRVTITALAANFMTDRYTNEHSGYVSKGVALADFNADGNTDYVVTFSDTRMAVGLGRGDGTFAESPLTSSNSDPLTMAAGDFDGDGKVDVLVCNNGIALLPGNGDGTFQAPIATGAACGSPTVADFDGDGRPDLLVAVTHGDFQIYLANGDGTFRKGVAGGVILNSPSLVVADFDGDRVADLAYVPAASNAIAVRLGDGAGGFHPATLYSTGADSVSFLDAGDLNLDGIPDLVGIGGSGYPGAYVLLGGANGTFLPARAINTGYAGPTAFRLADFDGDGKLDMVLGGSLTGLAVYYGAGDASFGPVTLYTSAEPSTRTIIAGDWNHDGQTDFLGVTTVVIVWQGKLVTMTSAGTGQSTAVGSPFASKLSVTLTDSLGNPVHGSWVSFKPQPAANGASATLQYGGVGGLDSTGAASLTATANFIPGSYTVVANTGGLSATFSLTNTLGPPATLALTGTPQQAAIGTTFPQPLRAQVRDVGGNPLSGVTVAFSVPAAGASSVLSSQTAVSDATGTATITATANVTVGPYAVTASAGAAVGYFQLTNVRPSTVTLMALANPTYGSAVGVAATVTPADASGKITFFDEGTPVALARLSLGRAVATIVMSASGNRRLTATYSGDASTAPSTSTPVVAAVGNVRANLLRLVASPGISGFSSTVVMADLNGDGKADLVTATGSFVNVALANGNGTFEAPVANYAFGPISGMAIADFDGDGLPDVVLSSAGQLRLLYGTGHAILGGILTAASDVPSGPLVTSDFNRDGKPDVAIGGTGTVQILLGNGYSTVQALGVSFPGGAARALSAGDFTGDGLVDIAIAADGGCYLLPGAGDGTFLAPLKLSSTAAAGVVAADLNGDGRIDLAFSASGVVIVFLGQADGSFQQSISSSRGAGSISAVDFDGDGKLDLLVPGGNGVALLRGFGDGRFQSPTDFLTERSTPESIAVGDLNGDGRADVVLGYRSYADVLVHLGVNAFIFAASGSEQGALTGTAFSSPLVAVLKDGAGAPVPGVYLTFVSPASGPGALLDFVGTPTSYTDANGAAFASATANNVAGPYAVGALSGLESVAFNLTNIDASAGVAAVSVSPAGGSGSTQTFAATFTASKGYHDLKWVQLLFATFPTSSQSYCFVHYDVQGNGLWLYGDGGFFIGPVTPGVASNGLQNSFCALNTSASTVSTTGTTLTVNASVVFKQAAPRNLWVRAMNQAETDTGWVARGAWNPVAAAAGTLSVTPASGSGSAQTFTATYPDPPGFAGAAFGWVQFLVAAASDGGGRPFCFVHYDRAGNGLWMYSSDVGFFLGPVAPGTHSNALSSSACSVDTAAATVTNTAGNLIVSVPITMKAPMAGPNKLFQRTLDTLNRDTGWQQTGTWTVQ